MSITKTFDFKKGSSFGAEGVYTPETGGPTNLTGVTIESSIRDSRNNIYTLSVTIIDSTHFALSYDLTDDWALGSAFWDLKFSKDGVVFYSDTVVINVLKNVTPASAS